MKSFVLLLLLSPFADAGKLRGERAAPRALRIERDGFMKKTMFMEERMVKKSYMKTVMATAKSVDMEMHYKGSGHKFAMPAPVIPAGFESEEPRLPRGGGIKLSCETAEDCGGFRFCGATGACLSATGECVVDADCADPRNDAGSCPRGSQSECSADTRRCECPQNDVSLPETGGLAKAACRSTFHCQLTFLKLDVYCADMEGDGDGACMDVGTCLVDADCANTRGYACASAGSPYDGTIPVACAPAPDRNADARCAC